MTGDTRSYALDISEHLFRLTTESLRLHSNETKRLETLGNLVDERVSGCSQDDYNPETIRDHLTAVPTKGDIRINLNITKSSADNLAEVKERFGKSLGSNISVGDTLSILLFQYVVSQKAQAVLQKLGFDEMEDRCGEAENSGVSSKNVVPLR